MKRRCLCPTLLLLLTAGCGQKTAILPPPGVTIPVVPFSMGTNLQTRGVMTSGDWTHLGHISRSIEQRHTVSDQDMSFWISLLRRGPLKDVGLNRLQFETLVMSNMDGRKSLTPLQQAKLYDAVLPFVSDPDSKFPALYGAGISSQMRDTLLRGNQENAIHLLATTRDARALPVLAQIAKDDKRPAIRHEAQKDYDRLQQVLGSKT